MCLKPGGNRLGGSADLGEACSHAWGPLRGLTSVVWPRQGKPRQHGSSPLVSHPCMLVLQCSHGDGRGVRTSCKHKTWGPVLGTSTQHFCCIWLAKQVTLQPRLKRGEDRVCFFNKRNWKTSRPWMKLISLKYLLCAKHCFGSMRVNSHVLALGFSNLVRQVMSILGYSLGWKVKFWLMHKFLMSSWSWTHVFFFFFLLCAAHLYLLGWL